MLVKELVKELENKKNRSAWDKGVNVYAIELVEELQEHLNYYNLTEVPTDTKELEKMLLNGASNWSQYSWGGCSLIYNGDIADRLCSPSEFKKCKEGIYRPNKNEEWLDVQARALFQACNRIKKIVYAYNKYGKCL